MVGGWGPADEGDETSVIGCSVRGQKNVESDTPCQDANEKRTLPGDKYVVAAADGLGSASLSHVGSEIATRAVADYVEESMTASTALDPETLRPLLASAFVHARKQIRQEANARGEPVAKLNTTLLVAVGGPAGVGGAAVGDGGIVWHRGGLNGLVISREETEYENKTIPLQSDDWSESYRFGWVADVDATAVFSDGLDGVAWDGPESASDDLFDQVFDSVRDFDDLEELEEFLADFLDSEPLRKSSRDDKTLVIGSLPANEWTDPADVTPAQLPTDTSEDDEDEGSLEDSPLFASGGDGSDQQDGTAGGTPSPVTPPSSSPGPGPPVEDRLGDTRSNRVSKGGGVVVVIVGAVIAALLFGLLVGGDDGGDVERALDLSSAELAGGDLHIEGTIEGQGVGDTVDATITVHGEGNETFTRENIAVNDGNFTAEIDHGTLDASMHGFDFYGDTEYEVSVAVAGETAETTLERGELQLEVESDTQPDQVGVEVSLTQGDEPVPEEYLDEITLDEVDPLDTSQGEPDDGQGSFLVHGSDDSSADEGELTVAAEFEGERDTATVELLEPRVEIRTDSDTTKRAGEEVEFSAEKFNEFEMVEDDDRRFRWNVDGPDQDDVITHDGEFQAETVGTYNITAERDGMQSEPITVTVVPADQDEVTVETRPQETAEGTAIEGPPAVTVTDGFGNAVEGVDVTVEVEDGEFAEDSTTTVSTNESGIATFEDLVIEEVGTYSLTFDADGVTEDVTSDSFKVVAAAPDDVSVEAGPENTTAGDEIAGPPAANVTDEFGNAVEGVEVTVEVEDGEFAENSTTTVSTNETGIATFEDLVIEDEGTYNLTFDAEGVAENATTGEFKIEQADEGDSVEDEAFGTTE